MYVCRFIEKVWYLTQIALGPIIAHIACAILEIINTLSWMIVIVKQGVIS